MTGKPSSLKVMLLRELFLLLLCAVLPIVTSTPTRSSARLSESVELVNGRRVYDASETTRTSKARPLVIWHGLGDSYNSPGILKFVSRVKDIHPGLFVHCIYLADTLDDDRRATFYGNVNEQVEQVATQLANITELTGGFDAIGFSQGGQFLRAYVERHNSPPVHNLITFGAQHMGISDIPGCRPFDVMCQLARRAALREVYTEWAQKQLVQAQYFRDPARLEQYLAMNRFLASINNEVRSEHNATYSQNLASLNKLVLILFLQDETVVPKESSWFGAYAASNSTVRVRPETSEDAAGDDGTGCVEEKTILPMRLQPLYLEDWIGLRKLDERGAVILETCDGEHMVLTDECWQPIVRRFVGGQVPDQDQEKATWKGETQTGLVVQP